MSGYQQYSGNPYSQAEQGYGGQSNPYGGAPGGYGASNPYGGQELNAPPALQHGDSNYSQPSQYSTNAALPPAHHGAGPLSRDDFLGRIEQCKGRINQLTSSIQHIASIHQRMLSSPDSNSSAQLESLVTQTQITNGQIKDEIKNLERDAARDSSSSFKRTHVESLKRSFKTQLQDFQNEESSYSKRYREAIARQYKIVNPEATDAEVQEAANADWGDEGIFQTALKSNRSGQATSVLGAVRARHNDIQRIEKTLAELAELFIALDEQVVAQDPIVQKTEEQTNAVVQDATQANTQLTKGIKSARNARKLKWWCLLIVVIILAIIGIVLGIYFGVVRPKNNRP